MKKSVGSFIALNRNLIIVLAVTLGALASGLIVWNVSAGSKESATERREEREAPRVTSPEAGLKAQAAIKPQANPRGMFRGVKTAERFDVSPPLRTMKGSPVEREERDRGI